MNESPRLSPSPASDDWLVGGGETGALIRTMDWSKTPLGPRERWPQSLRTTVNLCLNSNFPIAIVWGPHRTQLYNDGYWPICGAKHPQSMGQDFWECWPTSRPAIGTAFDQASAGEAAFVVNQRIFLDRFGYLEETFFTFSFSPIRDERGEVGGLFHPVTELTQQTLAERRLEVLRAVGDATAHAESTDETIAQAVAALGGHEVDLPFALVYLPDAERKRARLAGSIGLEPGTPAAPASIDIDSGDERSWPLARVLASGRVKVDERLSQRFGPLTCGPYPETLRSAILVPITLSGMEDPVAVLIAGISTRRALDDAYRDFYRMLSDAIGAALSSARTIELERERAEALAEIDRAKTVFFSNVSHEFRTPLTLMLGPLEEVLYDTSRVLADYDRERLDAAHRNGLRLIKLVNSLLDFARIEAGRAQATYLPTDLATYTAELASMFRSAVERAGLELVVDCPPQPEPVYVAPDMWEKIVLNLASNAFKFTFSGRIAVRLHGENGAAVLTVSDTGIGVPAEHLPRLFERFHRVPNARSRTYEGSGIGLALVNELVKLHGGTIRVDSTPGEGTTFTVTVPCGTAHLPAERIGVQPTLASTAIDARAFVEEALHWLPEPSPAAIVPLTDVPESSPRGEAESGARVLLADDNADMRRYVQALLTPRWRVEAVADGAQALEAIRRELPDLVLTDVMMPGLDGFGLLAALRADERTRSLPVIMLSARAGEEARVEGLEAGADDYLVKPFGARELRARVQTHLEIARLRKQAVELAQHDILTGLPNRGLSYELAERLLAAARRSGCQVAVLFIDMDRFKPINDTYGHEIGDEVLKEIAQRLKSGVRAEDAVGRIGGDEFLVVLSHIQDAADAARAARHLTDSLGRPYLVDGLELRSTPSIGIALFPDDGADIDTLVTNADMAMYHAKESESGRGGFQFYLPQLNGRAALAQHIEGRLRDGLKHGEFALHYQPIVDASSGALVGAEALARWPATGIGPDDFIPVAEASGMIDELGAWLFRKAFEQARQWLDLGLPGLTLSINVSPHQLRRERMPQAIAQALRECAVDPHSIQIELSETALLKNTDEVIATMRAMKRMGLQIVLDNFGKGHSSLSHLGRLPLDGIKIDHAFARTLVTEPASMAVVDAIVAIGGALGLPVVAEGIESAEVLAHLRERHCPRVQGYYLCPPVAADAFEDWCRHRMAA